MIFKTGGLQAIQSLVGRPSLGRAGRRSSDLKLRVSNSHSPSSSRTPLANIVEAPHNIAHRNGEQAADAKQRPERYGLSGFDLLPIAHGVSVGDHVFLAIPCALTQRLDARSQSYEECGFVLHVLFVSD
jgi:hypothetical protein